MLPRDVWVLLPTLYRSDQLRRTLKSLKATIPFVDFTFTENGIERHARVSEEVSVMVAVEADDVNSILAAADYGVNYCKCPKRRGGCAYAWNVALQNAPGTAVAFVLAADDVIFHEGWYEASMTALELLRGNGLVGFNDMHKRDGIATHFLATRQYLIEHNGGVIACPHYMVESIDVEAIERAQKAGKYAYAKDAHVEHDWNGKKPDKYYQESLKWIGKSRRLVEERRKAGWPNDYAAVIK